MGLFRPYERKTDDGSKTERTRLVPEAKAKAKTATKTVEAPEKVKVTRRAHAPKSEPTMTRKQAEAARMERLHPNLSPAEQRKADRAARAKARMEAWDKVEASPERVLARDFIDTRWTVTEFMLPAMLVIMAGTMATINNIRLSTYIGLLLWVVLIMSFINTWIIWRSFKRLLAQRHPNAGTRGLLMYMYNRALMIRRFRRPAPRINRGEAV